MISEETGVEAEINDPRVGSEINPWSLGLAEMNQGCPKPFMFRSEMTRELCLMLTDTKDNFKCR